MSTKAKVVMWVVIAVVVVGGAWWWLAATETAVSPTSPAANQTPQANGVSATDSSNAALQADLSNVDSQMNGFSSDNASISQGMSDQEVQQSQF